MPWAAGILGRETRGGWTADGGGRVRALLSVATRDGITVFARDLQSLDVELFATDGTREHLAADGVEVAPVAELTGVPALLGGQVKTFHPAIYAGILARRDRPEQLAELAEQGIEPIDLVVVNVKPFGAEIGRSLVGIERAIEMIDVGGAALLGAAARNAAGVVAVSSPEHYPRILAELRERGHGQPRAAGPARRRGVRHRRRVPRRDRGLPQPALGHELPEAPGDGPREGHRPALRREPAPVGGLLPRDDASIARASPTAPSSTADRRRSTTSSTSTSRTG